jgi:hypothetical protein
VLDRTPFYLEAGGQVSDVGELRDANGQLFARVDAVVRIAPGCRAPIACASRPATCTPAGRSSPT